VNTTLSDLEIFKENNTVKFKKGNNTIIEFNSDNPVNLANLFIEKQSANSTFSYIFIKGLILSENSKKTIYLERILNGTGLCIKDADISNISEISETCTEVNETWIACPGSIGNFTCNLTSNNTIYKISGLKHSGAREQQVYCGDSMCNGGETCSSCSADCGQCLPPPGGGGGTTGGGFFAPPTCKEEWSCSEWSSCVDGKQIRTCTDSNKCKTTKNKPSENQSCEIPKQEIKTETKICNPGEKKCSGNDTLECNSDGSEWNLIQKCEYGCLNNGCNDKPKMIGPPTGFMIVSETTLTLGVLILMAIVVVAGGFFYKTRKKKFSK